MTIYLDFDGTNQLIKLTRIQIKATNHQFLIIEYKSKKIKYDV